MHCYFRASTLGHAYFTIVSSKPSFWDSFVMRLKDIKTFSFFNHSICLFFCAIVVTMGKHKLKLATHARHELNRLIAIRLTKSWNLQRNDNVQCRWWTQKSKSPVVPDVWTWFMQTKLSRSSKAERIAENRIAKPCEIFERYLFTATPTLPWGKVSKCLY